MSEKLDPSTVWFMELSVILGAGVVVFFLYVVALFVSGLLGIVF